MKFDNTGREIVTGQDFDLNIQQTIGGQSYLPVTDASTNQLMTSILKELKKMNLHLAMINDVIIQDTEIDS